MELSVKGPHIVSDWKKHLALGHPISFCMAFVASCLDDISKDKNDKNPRVMPLPAGGMVAESGHIMCAVGWDNDLKDADDKSLGEHFLVQNSWGYSDQLAEGTFWMPSMFFTHHSGGPDNEKMVTVSIALTGSTLKVKGTNDFVHIA